MLDNDKLTGLCQGRGVRQGYWHAQVNESGATITLGCHDNMEFWANVRLTQGQLAEMLRQTREVNHE